MTFCVVALETTTTTETTTTGETTTTPTTTTTAGKRTKYNVCECEIQLR